MRRLGTAVVALVGLTVAACGGGDEPVATAEPSTTTEAPTTTTTEAASAAGDPVSENAVAPDGDLAVVETGVTALPSSSTPVWTHGVTIASTDDRVASGMTVRGSIRDADGTQLNEVDMIYAGIVLPGQSLTLGTTSTDRALEGATDVVVTEVRVGEWLDPAGAVLGDVEVSDVTLGASGSISGGVVAVGEVRSLFAEPVELQLRLVLRDADGKLMGAHGPMILAAPRVFAPGEATPVVEEWLGVELPPGATAELSWMTLNAAPEGLRASGESARDEQTT